MQLNSRADPPIAGYYRRRQRRVMEKTATLAQRRGRWLRKAIVQRLLNGEEAQALARNEVYRASVATYVKLISSRTPLRGRLESGGGPLARYPMTEDGGHHASATSPSYPPS